MSRLFVIEPDIMLRYGLAVALSSDHAVQFSDSLPNAAALKDIDAVIVDALTLARRGQPIAGTVANVDGWRLPTVWIDQSETQGMPTRRDWLTLTLPLQREGLLKAVFDCLNTEHRSKPVPTKGATVNAAAPKVRAKKYTAAAEQKSASADVIELVEVVEDEPVNG